MQRLDHISKGSATDLNISECVHAGDRTGHKPTNWIDRHCHIGFRFKLQAGDEGWHAWPGRYRLIFASEWLQRSVEGFRAVRPLSVRRAVFVGARWIACEAMPVRSRKRVIADRAGSTLSFPSPTQASWMPLWIHISVN